MTRGLISLLALFWCVACSRLSTLTPETLAQAQRKWDGSRPDFYRLEIEMEGDRVELARFEVTVSAGEVVSLRRNGQVIMPGQGQDYSMEGLFRTLQQELGLTEKPAVLGAPPGYSAYPMARFDQETGRLIQYRRTVGGTSNGIEIRVLKYDVAPAVGTMERN